MRQYLDFKLGGRDDQANLIARKAEREQIKAELEKMRLEEARAISTGPRTSNGRWRKRPSRTSRPGC